MNHYVRNLQDIERVLSAPVEFGEGFKLHHRSLPSKPIKKTTPPNKFVEDFKQAAQVVGFLVAIPVAICLAGVALVLAINLIAAVPLLLFGDGAEVCEGESVDGGECEGNEDGACEGECER